MPAARLQQQLTFLREIDKLKTIFRRSPLIADTSRLENSAEHSWHLSLFAITLAEYAKEPINLTKVLKLVLLHDLVEIYAGDTYAYDEAGQASAHERELKSAHTLFGMLPEDQRDELMALWHEFEEGNTAEAKFAITIDRLQPLLQNYLTGGISWKKHSIVRSQVAKRMRPVMDGSDHLHELVQHILDDAVKNDILNDG